METNPHCELRQALLIGERADVLTALQNEPSSQGTEIGAAHLVMLEHLVSHVVADTSSFAGIRVADVANGIHDALFDKPQNRAKRLAGAMGICHGPPPFVRRNRPRQIAGAPEDLDQMLRDAAKANDWEDCEDCLRAIGIRDGIKAVLYRLWSLTTEPHLLGHHRTEFVGNLADLAVLFDGDAVAEEHLVTLACNLGARLVARHHGDFSGRQHEPPHRGFVPDGKLVSYLEHQFAKISSQKFTQDAPNSHTFDHAAFLDVLRAQDPMEMFQAVTAALDQGVSVQSLYEQLAINSMHRIIRGPAANGKPAGWGRIKRGLLVSADVRKCLQLFPSRLAARVLYHAAFQTTFLPDDSFGEFPDLTWPESIDENPQTTRQHIERSMRAGDVAQTTKRTLQYLEHEYSGEDLLRFLRATTADRSCGQRALVDAWYQFRGTSDERIVMLAMARWGAFSYQS